MVRSPRRVSIPKPIRISARVSSVPIQLSKPSTPRVTPKFVIFFKYECQTPLQIAQELIAELSKKNAESRERELVLKAHNYDVLLEEKETISSDYKFVSALLEQREEDHKKNLKNTSKAAFREGHTSVVLEVKGQWTSHEFAAELMYGNITQQMIICLTNLSNQAVADSLMSNMTRSGT